MTLLRRWPCPIGASQNGLSGRWSSCKLRPATTLDWASTQVQTAPVGAHGKRGEIFKITPPHGYKRARIDYGTGVSNPECLRFFATSYSRTLHARSDTAGRLRHAVYVSCLLELRWRHLAYCFPQRREGCGPEGRFIHLRLYPARQVSLARKSELCPH